MTRSWSVPHDTLAQHHGTYHAPVLRRGPMQIPVDTTMLRFTVVGAPEPARRRQRTPAETDTRTPAGQDGERWRVRLRVAGEGFNQIVRVSVPGNPRLEPGSAVI